MITWIAHTHDIILMVMLSFFNSFYVEAPSVPVFVPVFELFRSAVVGRGGGKLWVIPN